MSYSDLQITQPSKVLINVNGNNNSKKEFITVISDLIGDLKGKTMLVFNKTEKENLTKTCMSIEYSQDEGSKKMEEAFLLEFGNILTGSLVTQFSNIFNLKIHAKVPFLQSGLFRNIMDAVNKEYELITPMILIIHTVFVIKNIELRPHLLLIFDETSMDKMHDVISTFDTSDRFLF
ncbi:MAG: chemotaxis protein CheC [Bacteroidetes bacterium]|nr:chemotaxis protein CheC [Bacteroidota bacterium]